MAMEMEMAMGSPYTDGCPKALRLGEIVDYIIDHLHDDTPTLSASSLVCRAWLPSCRYHLFETVYCRLTPATRISCLHYRLVASPNVHPYVKTITIFAADPDSYLPEVLVEELDDLLLCLPLLRNLVMHHISLSSSRLQLGSVASYISPTCNNRRLEKLVLLHCKSSDGTFHPLCHILGLFAEVDELTIHFLECSWDPDQVTESSDRLLELAHHIKFGYALRLFWTSSPGVDDVITYLADHAPEGKQWPLCELYLMSPTLLSTNLASALLRLCHETLQTLCIDVTSYLIQNMLEDRPFALLDHWRSLPIRACLHLETLVVTFCNVPADDSELRTQGYRKACLEAKLELVNSAPPSLTLLLVQFGNGDTDEMSHVRSWDLPDFALYWSSLDNAIMRLPVLQVVAFAFSPPQVVEWATSHERTIFINSNNSNPPLELGPEEDAACKAFLESALPQTYAKGLIKLVLKDETIGSFAADRTNR